jgi:formylglycine-generating enzyme required for sulfatase activity
MTNEQNKGNDIIKDNTEEKKRTLKNISLDKIAAYATILGTIIALISFLNQGPAATPTPLPTMETPLATIANTAATSATNSIDEGVPPQNTNAPASQEQSQIKTSDMDGMAMLLVPAGDFIMGNTWPEELQSHTVYLDAYYIDKTEVSLGMYKKCVDAGVCNVLKTDMNVTNGSYFPTDYFSNPQYDNYPVSDVAWMDARTYCEWAGRRLPSEAEWEKAARGRDERVLPWGTKELNCSLVNGEGCTNNMPDPVDSRFDGASPYGALNMLGNVYEYVNDWYGEDYYINSPLENPRGPNSGSSHVFRGQCWRLPLDTAFFNVYDRMSGGDSGDITIGFRCASSVE